MCCLRSTGPRPFALILIMVASALLGHAAQVTGTLRSGPTPIASSHVTLHSAGTFSSHILGTAQSDANGFFSIVFTAPSDPKAVLYLTADGGSPRSNSQAVSGLRSPIRLAAVLGTRPIPGEVVINERTTVASAYAVAQFISGDRIAGESPGLQNAAATVSNLVNLRTGEVGTVLGSVPNGIETSTMPEFNSLANMLASCVNTPASCATLFSLATPPGGSAPRDTLQAAVNVAHYPGQNVGSLFQQSQGLRLYSPDLASAPDAWTLAIRYNGNGAELDGPGNMAVDKDGNVWSTNNYQFSNDPFMPVCGGEQLIKFTPTGSDVPGAPYSGGGLYGAGFGITLDPKGDVWVGNFGFEGVNCVPDPNHPGYNVSQFSPDGTALSPADGFTQGDINQPQATVSDQQGNIWIANCGKDSVTQFPAGNPDDPRKFTDIGLLRPFGLAIDGEGNTWITSNGNNRVVALAPDGTLLPGSPFRGRGIDSPLGVAVDSGGNVWIANSGIIQLPCAFKGGLQFGKGSVTQLKREGRHVRSSKFTGGGMTVPWGVAVDGNDNIWVANFAGQRLTELCGARPSNCPPGLRTGDPISPDTGYTSDGLTRNTGVAIDPSGNVWLANNWLNVALQTNPGGHELVVFIGLAAPVKTPLIGPPQRP